MATEKIDHLVRELRQRVVSGEFRTGARFPSEYVLARQYRVNKETANRAVHALAQEGFVERRGRGAGTFVRKTDHYPKGTIAVIGGLPHSFFAAIMEGIAKTAESTGYLPVLYTPAPERLYETVSRARAAKCRGILTFLYGFLGHQRTDLPVVHIDHPGVIDAEINLVESNGRQGGRLQAEMLLRYGHRDVAYVSPLANDSRCEGFRDCLGEHGIADAAARIFAVGSARTNYRSLLARILARYPNLTGLGCFSDYEAAALIRVAHQEGIDLLKRISVIGFGNVRDVCDFHHLTTIEQHPMELGAVACQRLVEMIESQRPCHGLREQCDVELKPGSTVFRVVSTPSA